MEDKKLKILLNELDSWSKSLANTVENTIPGVHQPFKAMILYLLIVRQKLLLQN
jgi:hypothetical protein